MSSSLFQFKQFAVAQDRCAMKIGTDSILLGAWVSLKKQPNSILDIGAGTGVIALQMAQRSKAEIIDAVEIDDDAFEQCSENFENSPWGDRLFCYHASIQEFASEVEDKYDLIISNPPFFEEHNKNLEKTRATARFTTSLPFQHLIVCVAHLLSKQGVFAIVIPHRAEKDFLDLAAKSGLWPERVCRVKGTPSSEIKRSLIAFGTHKTKLIEEDLTVEISRHKYTDEYIEIVSDFYLKM